MTGIPLVFALFFSLEIASNGGLRMERSTRRTATVSGSAAVASSDGSEMKAIGAEADFTAWSIFVLQKRSSTSARTVLFIAGPPASQLHRVAGPIGCRKCP